MKKVAAIVGFFGLRSVPILIRFGRFHLARAMGKRFIVANVYDSTLTVPLDSDGIGRGLYVYGGRELDHKWILEQMLRPGDVIFDLGSNIGYYAVLQSRILRKQCELLCVEPDPRNVELLRKNIDEHGLSNVARVEHCAIADYEGEGSLILEGRTNLSRLDPDGSRAGTKVPVHDFAGYLERVGRPIDVVRMDIEGGEIGIFRSLLAALASGRTVALPKVIVFETHDYKDQAPEMRRLMLGLFDLGYRVAFLASDDEARGAPVLQGLGYRPMKLIPEMGVVRGVYNDVSPEHAAQAISGWKGTRTVCLTTR